MSAFAFGLAGFIFSGIAGLIVFGNLVSTGAQDDLVSSAAPTIIGLAVPGLIGFVGGFLALAFPLDRQRLGRSLAWTGITFSVLSWLNLVGYAIRLNDIDRKLKQLQTFPSIVRLLGGH